MKPNKHIQRDEQEADKIFDNRSLTNDYRNLISILKPNMKVLDVGCGTGFISKDIANLIGAMCGANFNTTRVSPSISSS